MIKLIAGLTLLVGLLTGYIASISQGPTFGSTVQGNDYFSTSTRNHSGTILTNLTRLKDAGNSCVSGALARVTVTGAGAAPGITKFWDATTTDATLRADTYSSSTIFLAQLPTAAAANTYDFDLTFNCGLIYEYTGSGATPTSTIMWR